MGSKQENWHVKLWKERERERKLSCRENKICRIDGEKNKQKWTIVEYEKIKQMCNQIVYMPERSSSINESRWMQITDKKR